MKPILFLGHFIRFRRIVTLQSMCCFAFFGSYNQRQHISKYATCARTNRVIPCHSQDCSFVWDLMSWSFHCVSYFPKIFFLYFSKITVSVFIADGQGQHPALIDMYGSTGGLAEHRAAMLASRGFTTLSLAYIGYQDLPKTPKIDCDYFIVIHYSPFQSDPHPACDFCLSNWF